MDEAELIRYLELREQSKTIEGPELDRKIRELMREDGYSKGIEDIVQAALARFLPQDRQPKKLIEFPIAYNDEGLDEETRVKNVSQVLLYNAAALKELHKLEMKFEYELMSLVIDYSDNRNEILTNLNMNEKCVRRDVAKIGHSVKTEVGEAILDKNSGEVKINMIDLRGIVLLEMQDRINILREIEKRIKNGAVNID